MYCRSSFPRSWKRAPLLFIPIVMIAGFLLIDFLSQVALAQTKVPLEAQSGIIEKSLSQSPPKFEPLPEPEAPKITKESRPTPKDRVAGPTFFIKKIKLTGNTMISDKRLMPLVDLGEGKSVNMSILNAIAKEDDEDKEGKSDESSNEQSS